MPSAGLERVDSAMDANERHYYELIKEGGERDNVASANVLIFVLGAPCHLYFDIEFDRAMNPSRDGLTALAVFKQAGYQRSLVLLGAYPNHGDSFSSTRLRPSLIFIAICPTWSI